ncbi:hypothetical protein BaRGS_00038859, partial [Batillaria attramentaria]
SGECDSVGPANETGMMEQYTYYCTWSENVVTVRVEAEEDALNLTVTGADLDKVVLLTDVHGQEHFGGTFQSGEPRAWKTISF